MPRIVFCVTNDLTYDQRMHRICGTMAASGFEVLLTGRQMKGAVPMKKAAFEQKRLRGVFSKGPLFYAAYNIRLFLFLLFTRKDILCAIDLDTILPVYFASLLTGTRRVYDAHELFTEQKEVITRPFVHRTWTLIEQFAVPRFPNGYTVNEVLADIFRQRYGVSYLVIPNLPLRTNAVANQVPGERYFLYQGAVNEGRCFETLIPAMMQVPSKLIICGTGNFFDQAVQLVNSHQLQDKIIFKGNVLPEDLKAITAGAFAGLTLFEEKGLNQYYSLSNRFFDYIMAGIPQVCVNYPLYAAVNEVHQVMLPVQDTQVGTIAAALNRLLTDERLYTSIRNNCVKARETLHWDTVTPALISFYQQR